MMATASLSPQDPLVRIGKFLVRSLDVGVGRRMADQPFFFTQVRYSLAQIEGQTLVYIAAAPVRAQNLSPLIQLDSTENSSIPKSGQSIVMNNFRAPIFKSSSVNGGCTNSSGFGPGLSFLMCSVRYGHVIGKTPSLGSFQGRDIELFYGYSHLVKGARTYGGDLGPTYLGHFNRGQHTFGIVFRKRNQQ